MQTQPHINTPSRVATQNANSENVSRTMTPILTDLISKEAK